MATLVIQHIEASDPPRFQIVRAGDDTKAVPAGDVPSPAAVAVPGWPDGGLAQPLQWYLENFLDYPFSPDTERAERVQTVLQDWGRACFRGLFGGREAAVMLDHACGDGHENLVLQVASSDPQVLAWPWEALHDDGLSSPLGQLCRIERRVYQTADPQPMPENLPSDAVNILLVTARPFARDVRYRSISRPLVELIETRDLPAHVHVLRPPTFGRLCEHLRERPNFYHILHFDGHGSYGADPHSAVSLYALTAQGQLVFEKPDGDPDPVPAEKLAPLLREFRIPAVVLNACQSGMIDGRAKNPFAGVAAALLQAGIRSVVAMAYSLYVSAAQEFLPAFYRRLFEAGNVAEAVRAGRQRMFHQDGRVCARGRFPLRDWLVPVLYQQQPHDFSFAAAAKKEKAKPAALPEEAADRENPYGFVGRDGAVLELERALRRPRPAILVHGLGGVGKTTLARGFVHWLSQTQGLGNGCLWISFVEVRSADYVINRMGEPIFGPNFAAHPIETRIDALAKALHEHPLLVVWDNFEVAKGIPAAGIPANLSDDDRDHLLALLKKLHGGQTKILITSRSEETWLGETRCPVSLSGLDGEERWEYCQAILDQLGKKVDREDMDQVELMALLDGHPLAMRVIVPKLAEMPAKAIAAALRSNLADLDLGQDESQRKLYATLAFAQTALPQADRNLLIGLALHERFLDASLLQHMAKQVDPQWTDQRLRAALDVLTNAGLLRNLVQGQIYELHPALTGYLRSTFLPSVAADLRDRWTRAFVDVMGTFADHLAPRPLHEQQLPFHIHQANLHSARNQALRLAMAVDCAALTQSLAAHAQNTRNWKEAERLFGSLAENCAARGDKKTEAATYHQLGIVAQERRDFAAAESWYRRSLEIEEKFGNERGAASTYLQLGTVALERRDFAAAESWYRRSLEITEKLGDEQGAALTYHQLGRVAQEHRDFAAAEMWYRRSLEIKEKPGDEHGAASTYLQLGTVALERRDFAAAESWYHRSLEIEEKLGDEHGAASTYHQLGIVAQERRDFAAAESWYHRSLEIEEKLGDEHSATMTYHQLGMVAEERRDFAAAESWYRRSLEIKEKLGNEHGAAITYHQLGMVAQERRDFPAAETWYRRSLPIWEKLGDEHGAASTCGQLGILAELQGRFEDSGTWLIKSILAFRLTHDQQGVEQGMRNFLILYRRAPEPLFPRLRAMWEDAGLGAFPEDQVPPATVADGGSNSQAEGDPHGQHDRPTE
ncbi:MAG: tetratricopeptide repeat protein [Phycisphaerae bacterium]|nr:tetratricopeptide repeat protein [Phycisphaerae bacterium]